MNWQISKTEELFWRHPSRITNWKSPGPKNQVIVCKFKIPIRHHRSYKSDVHVYIQGTLKAGDHQTFLFPHSAPVSSAPDPKVAAVAQQLDKLDNDLVSAEESLLSRLRAPLSRTDPAGDLANRLREQEVRRYRQMLTTAHFSSFPFISTLTVAVSVFFCICSFSQCHLGEM